MLYQATVLSISPLQLVADEQQGWLLHVGVWLKWPVLPSGQITQAVLGVTVHNGAECLGGTWNALHPRVYARNHRRPQSSRVVFPLWRKGEGNTLACQSDGALAALFHVLRESVDGFSFRAAAFCSIHAPRSLFLPSCKVEPSSPLHDLARKWRYDECSHALLPRCQTFVAYYEHALRVASFWITSNGRLRGVPARYALASYAAWNGRQLAIGFCTSAKESPALGDLIELLCLRSEAWEVNAVPASWLSEAAEQVAAGQVSVNDAACEAGLAVLTASQRHVVGRRCATSWMAEPSSRPVWDGSILYFVDKGGFLVCWNCETGRANAWRVANASRHGSSLAVVDGIAVTCHTNCLASTWRPGSAPACALVVQTKWRVTRASESYAVGSQQGTILWIQKLPLPPLDSIALGAGVLVAHQDGVSHLDIYTGMPLRVLRLPLLNLKRFFIVECGLLCQQLNGDVILHETWRWLQAARASGRADGA
jgi:hypothetical protein